MVGVGGYYIFTLTAKRAGKANCTFEYGRPWAPNTFKENPENKRVYSFQITK